MATTLDKLIRIVGGARITWRGQTFYTQDAINISIRMERFDVPTQWGMPIPLLRRRWAEITFTPVGAITAAALSALYQFPRWDGAATEAFTMTNWGAAKPGDIIMPVQATGASGDDLVIDPFIAGTAAAPQNKWTFYRATCLKPPDLFLGVTRTMLGQVTLTALGKEDSAIAAGSQTDNHLFKVEANGGALSDFTTANLIVERYSGAWGAILTGLLAEEGWAFSCTPNLEELAVDGFGVPLYMVQSVGAQARARVGSITDTNLTALINANNEGAAAVGALGSIMTKSPMTQTLTLTSATGATRKVELFDCRLFTATPTWEVRATRSGELVFENVRSWTAGVPTNVFTLTWA